MIGKMRLALQADGKHEHELSKFIQHTNHLSFLLTTIDQKDALRHAGCLLGTWIESARRIVSSLMVGIGDPTNPWLDPINVRLAFQMTARRLATVTDLEVTIRDELNSFCNERPFIYRTVAAPHYYHTFNLVRRQSNLLESNLEEFKQQKNLTALVVKPDQGLIACHLLEYFPPAVLSKLDLVGAPLRLTYERAVLHQNLRLCSEFTGHSMATIIPGSSYEGAHGLPAEAQYDFIYIEGRRSLKERQDPVELFSVVLKMWIHLKKGGKLILDDQDAFDHPLSSPFAPSIYPILGDGLCSLLRGSCSISKCGCHLVLMKYLN